MLDIICSIFDMALIIIFFNAIMKKRREAVPFWLFFYFRLHRRTSWLFSPVSFYAKQNHSFLYNGRISLLSLFTLSFFV